MEGFWILTKEKELNNNYKEIHKGDTIVGIIQPGSFAVGLSLVVANAKKYRITSIVKEIKEDGEGGYIIETLNSIYSLKPHVE